MAYALTYRVEARDELRRRSQRVQRVIAARVRALTVEPEPPDSAPLEGEWEGHRRVHVLGTLRIVYRVEHRPAPQIEIVKIGGRGSVYRRRRR